MKKGVLFGLTAGILITLALFANSGFGKIGAAITAAGWAGVMLMALAQMLPLMLRSLAWRLVSLPESAPGFAAFFRAHWVRDGIGAMWITPPLGSELAGMRMLTLEGMQAPQAAAVTLVDLTEEMASQIAYTLTGVLLIAFSLPQASFIIPALAALLIAAAAIGGFAYAQNAGLLLRVEGMVSTWTSAWLEPVRLSIQGIHDITSAIYRRKGPIFLAFVVHLCAWLGGALATWIGLRFIGHPLGWQQVIALEAIVAALRSLAFVAPAGLGVQEAGYLLVGHLFGLSAADALALSMLQRASEWLRAFPALLMWQAYEGRRWWRFGSEKE